MSGFNALNAILISLLYQKIAPIPTAQTILLYASLFLVFYPLYSIKKKTFLPWNQNRSVPAWKYLIIALFDVEANFLVVTSLKYTSVTYVTLIASFTTPCSMILSKILLKKKYKVNHYLGVGICLFALFGLVVADYLTLSENSNEELTALKILIGNGLCLASAFCFSAQNVGVEYTMKESNLDPFEILSTMGFFGFCFSVLQTLLLEHATLVKIKWDFEIVLLILSYDLSQFLLYSFIPILVHMSSASFMNLSFLTSNIYAFFGSILLFGFNSRWFYFASLGVTILGISSYSLLPESNEKSEQPQQDEEKKEFLEEIDEEFSTIEIENNSNVESQQTFFGIFVFGQFVAMLNSSTGVLSTLLNKNGVDIPTTQSSILYLTLFVVYYTLFCIKSKTILPWKQKRIISFWKYSIVGFVDVEANFLAILAYRYITITNASLLLSFSTPSAMILSIFILRRKYKWNHFIGVIICLTGIFGLILADYFVTSETNSSSAKMILFGNICVIVATIFYASSNVAVEYLMKQKESSLLDSVEVLSMGTSTFIFDFRILFEHQEIIQINWSWSIVAYLCAFTSVMFLLYTSIPVLITLSSATFLNISLLTVNVYSLITSIIIFAFVPKWYYFLSFCVTVIGILVYNAIDENFEEKPQEMENKIDEETVNELNDDSVPETDVQHEESNPTENLISDEMIEQI
eukprot:gene6268-10275_t